jgi:NADP-dependent 3-hydroxy acid dehydrogenase YdfG
VLERGWNAVVTARNPAMVQDIVACYPDAALAVALDETDRTQVAEAVRTP